MDRFARRRRGNPRPGMAASMSETCQSHSLRELIFSWHRTTFIKASLASHMNAQVAGKLPCNNAHQQPPESFSPSDTAWRQWQLSDSTQKRDKGPGWARLTGSSSENVLWYQGTTTPSKSSHSFQVFRLTALFLPFVLKKRSRSLKGCLNQVHVELDAQKGKF